MFGKKKDKVKTFRFHTLGVMVKDGMVYRRVVASYERPAGTKTTELLGPLAGCNVRYRTEGVTEEKRYLNHQYTGSTRTYIYQTEYQAPDGGWQPLRHWGSSMPGFTVPALDGELSRLGVLIREASGAQVAA